MLRFKQFAGSPADLEQAVNQWLDEYEPDVRQMVQTTGGDGNVSISFLYEESFMGQERRLSRESGMAAATRPVIDAESIPGQPVHVAEEPGDIVPESG